MFLFLCLHLLTDDTQQRHKRDFDYAAIAAGWHISLKSSWKAYLYVKPPITRFAFLVSVYIDISTDLGHVRMNSIKENLKK